MPCDIGEWHPQRFHRTIRLWLPLDAFTARSGCGVSGSRALSTSGSRLWIATSPLRALPQVTSSPLLSREGRCHSGGQASLGVEGLPQTKTPGGLPQGGLPQEVRSWGGATCHGTMQAGTSRGTPRGCHRYQAVSERRRYRHLGTRTWRESGSWRQDVERHATPPSCVEGMSQQEV